MKMQVYDSYKYVHDVGAYVASMYYKRDTLVVSSDGMVEQLMLAKLRS